MSFKQKVAAMLLVVFVIAGTIGGFCWSPALGFVLLAFTSFVTSFLLGWE